MTALSAVISLRSETSHMEMKDTNRKPGTRAGKNGETKSKVAKLTKVGVSDDEIAVQLGISRSMVIYHRQALGLPPGFGWGGDRVSSRFKAQRAGKPRTLRESLE